jgi:hypothetical protein
MTGLGTGFFLAFFTGLFVKGGNGGGGSGGVSAVKGGGLQGEGGKLEQGENDDFFPLSVEGAGGFFVKSVCKQGANIWWGRTRRHR